MYLRYRYEIYVTNGESDQFMYKIAWAMQCCMNKTKV
jgi:hypothetical protein